ncbi:uncharacterized protein LOC109807147 [Cajanus cajan]|uniref:Reverse transcriptase domain-containing protein n=1 Tax=Cajanus cajan TaxID=3821 RepID=A0A151SNC9_CAJCA|nr:uncharacterized protein LOC109807147 [Cajanus cajan]KYP56242.1 hypothetical protein KK1_002479 [Cajanus cajan]
MGRNVSTLIGKPIPHIPEKCKDPGTFTIPCIIGDKKFDNALLDLRASINVMPMSIFNSLSLGPLKPTSVVIQLANRSTAHPAGVIEDVLVRVDKLIFPAYFYVLHMEEGYSHGVVPIILGMPFLNTARTKIDVHTGTLSMEFDDSVVRFNIHDAMRHTSEEHSVFHVDLFDELINEYVLQFFQNVDSSPLACVDSKLCSSHIDVDIDVGMNINESDSVVEMQHAASLSITLVPSIVQPPILELKPLPENLKYAYLEDNNKLPVIVSTSLNAY